MSKRGKRYTDVASQIDRTKTYSLEEAVDLIKQAPKEKFDASIEVHLHLGIDTKKSDQQIRSTIVLPHGTGKTKKIAAFVEPEKEKEAKDAGAALVGGEQLINQIKQTGKCDFEIAVATPTMMPKMAAIAKILGPKGLMPSPKNETIAPNVKKIIEELGKGKVAFKSDNTGNIHQLIGKVSFEKKQLLENLQIFLDAVKKVKPSSSKGVFIKSATLCTTMSPGIKIAV
ncbi:MAG: 50S ribosomal protein L1 [Patescibacteria group bacterium]